MKVAIEHSALMDLMLACGEAQGVLLRGGQLAHGDSSLRNFSSVSNSTRENLQKALDALNATPIAPAPQQEFHSGPG